MRFLLGGVNGAGKTTLLQKIKELKPEYEVVKGSQAFMEYLGIPGDYEALRAIPQPEALEKFSDLTKELLEKYDHLVLDSHYMNLVRGHAKKVAGDYLKNFDALLLLKVSPETVLARTANETRDRALFPPGLTKDEEFAMLADYIQQYDQEFENLCAKYGVTGHVLDGEKTPDEIAQEFLAFADSLQ